jgi:hypothetical protein
VDLNEWSSAVSFVREDVRAIIRAQRTHRAIRLALEARDELPLEEDFIDADLADGSVGAARPFEIEGVQIVVRKLHRRGLAARDIMGADLLYEIEGQKFTIIQYKTPDSHGRVGNVPQQLTDLVDNCPEMICGGRVRWPHCGSWHAIRSNSVSLYHQACEARHIFDGAASRNVAAFSSGLSKDTFDELFALCWIGAPISPSAMAGVVTSTINASRVLFSVKQRGRF